MGFGKICCLISSEFPCCGISTKSCGITLRSCGIQGEICGISTNIRGITLQSCGITGEISRILTKSRGITAEVAELIGKFEGYTGKLDDYHKESYRISTIYEKYFREVAEFPFSLLFKCLSTSISLLNHRKRHSSDKECLL